MSAAMSAAWTMPSTTTGHTIPAKAAYAKRAGQEILRSAGLRPLNIAAPTAHTVMPTVYHANIPIIGRLQQPAR